jgi:pyridoxamine 5'-phosphate oxidase
MDKKSVFDFIEKNNICHIATVSKGVPHVRAILVYRADEDGIIMHTSKSKDLYKQLIADPQVELCFNDYSINTQLRVSGTIDFIEDLEVKKEIAKKREKLQAWIQQVGYDMMAVLRLQNGIAHFWIPELTFMFKRYIQL